MANTQRSFHLTDAVYEDLRAYFSRIHATLKSQPPRLAEIPEFADLYARVHGEAPQGGEALRVV
jgi:hypothetical protein